MEIKIFFNKIIQFIINRLIELIGVILSIFSLFLLISLLSYSPEDPNFIISDTKDINNILGTKGSYTSDLFFQSIGLISILSSISFLITGINITRSKKIILIFQNFFFTILYVLLGSIFFSYFYPDAFKFAINGNGGFIGNYLSTGILISVIEINTSFSFYAIIVVVIYLFFVSINLNLKAVINLIRKIIFSNLKQSKKTQVSNLTEYEEEKVEINNKLIQEDLPFDNIKSQSNRKIRYQLPSIKLLKIPEKKQVNKNEENENGLYESLIKNKNDNLVFNCDKDNNISKKNFQGVILKKNTLAKLM